MECEQATARWLGGMGDGELLSTVLAQLRLMFPDAPPPTRHIIARLSNESFQRGAFSFMPPFGDERLHKDLHLPWADGRLMLAGEHTSWLHAGTVHGALIAGRQAAHHVLAIADGWSADVSSWWRTSYTDRYVERLRQVLGNDDDEDEYSWDRNP